MTRLRLAFMGTAAFGVPSLEALLAAGHEIAAVYSQPPRPAGRGKKERRSAIHEAAARLGLEVRTPARLRDDRAAAAFEALGLDLAVVAAYGLLLPTRVLAAPRLGCVNIHASLLPRWRGAAPIQRALLAGDRESGICVFQMEEGLDTGPVFARHALELPTNADAQFLHDRLQAIAAAHIVRDVDAIQNGAAAIPQADDGVTYAKKLEKEEGRIDFREDAAMVARRLRALNPWPGCFAAIGGERLRLLAGEPVTGSGEPGVVIGAPLLIACGDGAIRIDRAQRAGKAPMTTAELARGFALEPGARFDLPSAT